MKTPSTLVAILVLTLIGSACAGRERTRPGAMPDADTGMVDVDGGLPWDASDDGFAPDAGEPLDAAADASASDATTRIDSSVPPADSSLPPVDSSTPPADTGTPPATCAPSVGALAIVEVMIASQSGTDQGEWFEIVNDGTCIVDLRGLEIGSPATDGAPVTHAVTAGTVAPGEHFVFALSGDPADNHDLPWDYVYGSGTRADVFLGNAGDALTIAYGGLTLDRIEWTAEDFVRGAALQYPRGASPSANEDLSRWCDATHVYSSTGGIFYGTPGAPNDPC